MNYNHQNKNDDFDVKFAAATERAGQAAEGAVNLSLDDYSLIGSAMEAEHE